MNLPPPTLYWGGAAHGGQGQRSANTLFAKYQPGIPLNAGFKILSWECQVNGAPGAGKKGTGSNVSDALSLISQARPGMIVNFDCWIVGPDGVRQKLLGAYKL
jgi:hypothetical protein